MSLINRVLQDLDQRGADPSPDSKYSGEIRPVATAAGNKRHRVIVWLLAGFGAVLVALAVWPGRAVFEDFPAGLWAGREHSPAATTAAAPTPQRAEPVRERVEAALMVPVFQLSGELATLPTRASVKSSVPQNSKPGAARKTALKLAAATTTEKGPNEATTSNAGAVSPTQVRAAKQTQKQSATPANSVSNKPVSKEPVTREDVVVVGGADEQPLEQIVIPADIPASQIEKQSRELTSYERAEVAFREGVSSLRRGQLDEAESRFRLAINEDRSHAAAQQALIGMLIDAGRLQDAEDVLHESLDVNARQPTLAMVLARLQVERGDLETAVETLDRVSPYAGTDANFLSFSAAVLQRAQRHEQAVVQYRNALALMPRNPVWLMGLGISLRELDENEQAQQAFASAAAIGTLSPDLQAFVEGQQRALQRAVN